MNNKKLYGKYKYIVLLFFCIFIVSRFAVGAETVQGKITWVVDYCNGVNCTQYPTAEAACASNKSDPFYANSILSNVEINVSFAKCEYSDISGGPTVFRQVTCPVNSNTIDTSATNPQCECTSGFKAAGLECVEESVLNKCADGTGPCPLDDAAIKNLISQYEDRIRNKKRYPSDCIYYNWPEKGKDGGKKFKQFVIDLPKQRNKLKCDKKLTLNTAVLQETVQDFSLRHPYLQPLIDYRDRAGKALSDIQILYREQCNTEKLKKQNHCTTYSKFMKILQGDVMRSTDFLGGTRNGKDKKSFVAERRPDRVELFFNDEWIVVTDATHYLDVEKLPSMKRALQPPDAKMHYHKTCFYAAVLEEIIGWTKSASIDYTSRNDARAPGCSKLKKIELVWEKPKTVSGN